MKYLIYLLFFLMALFPVFFWMTSQKKLNKKFLRNIFIQKLESAPPSYEHITLFSSSIIDLLIDFILKKPKKVQKQILSELEKNRYKTLIKKTRRADPILADLFQKLFTGKTQNAINKQNKAIPASFSYCIFLESAHQYQKLDNVLKNIPNWKLNKKQRAFKEIFRARSLLTKTDLKKASQILMKSMKTLRKNALTDELAYAYFLLGEIYRITGTHDIARMMFEISSGIYKKLQHPYGQNFITSAKALNAVGQKNFDEANSLFQKALDAHKKNNDELHEAEILNQQALLFNLQNTPLKAEKAAQKALKKHKNLKNSAGMGFSYEQLAVSKYKSSEFLIAEKHALNAQKIYSKEKNKSAYAEMLALLAQIYMQTNNSAKLRKIRNRLKILQKQNPSYFLLENLQNLRQDINTESEKK